MWWRGLRQVGRGPNDPGQVSARVADLARVPQFLAAVVGMKTTRSFQEQVLRKRPYFLADWCEGVLRHPLRVEQQGDGRVRHWGYIREVGTYLRVVTLEDGWTVQTRSSTAASGPDGR